MWSAVFELLRSPVGPRLILDFGGNAKVGRILTFSWASRPVEVGPVPSDSPGIGAQHSSDARQLGERNVPRFGLSCGREFSRVSPGRFPPGPCASRRCASDLKEQNPARPRRLERPRRDDHARCSPGRHAGQDSGTKGRSTANYRPSARQGSCGSQQ
jgi:hypothetical protein